jgi:hypothetical protein
MPENRLLQFGNPGFFVIPHPLRLHSLLEDALIIKGLHHQSLGIGIGIVSYNGLSNLFRLGQSIHPPAQTQQSRYDEQETD